MTKQDQPAIPALVTLDDVTLEAVVGGVGKTMPGATMAEEMAAFAALTAAQRTAGLQSRAEARAAAMEDLHEAMGTMKQQAGQATPPASAAAGLGFAQALSAVKQDGSKTSLLKEIGEKGAHTGLAPARERGASGEIGTAGSGLGQFVGTGHTIAGGQQDATRNAEVEQQLTKTEAVSHPSRQEHAAEMMNQLMDVIRDVRDRLSSIEQSRIETTRGITRNI
jgi:hypothetical protein